MRTIAIFIFSCFCLQAFCQSEFKQIMPQVDSLLKLEQDEVAHHLLDSVIQEKVRLKDWKLAAMFLEEASRLFNSEKSQEAIAYLESATSHLILNNLHEDDFVRAKIFVQKGFRYDKLHEVQLSLDNYDRAIAIFEKSKDKSPVVPYTYRKAGQLAIRILDYEKTKSYFHGLLRTDTVGRYHLNAYAFLCMASKYLEEYDEAIECFNKGIKLEGRKKDWFLLNNEGATTYALRQEPTRAISLLEDNFSFIRSLPKEDQLAWEWMYYRISGEVYETLGEVKKAEGFFQKAIEKTILYRNGKKHRSIAKAYTKLGDLFLKNKKYTQALNAFHSGMIQAFPRFDKTNVLENPSLNEVALESFMMTTAKGKASSLLNIYFENKQLKYLKAAGDCFDIALSGSSHLNTTFSDDDAKFYLENFNAETLENAIYVNSLLLQETGDYSYFNKAFDLTEQHKSLVLREAIIQNKSLNLAGIPDSILVKEQSLQEEVSGLKQKIKEITLVNAEQDKSQLETLKSQLGIAQNQYSFLLTALKKSNPIFAKSMQQVSHVGVDDIQNDLLDEQTVLLQYQWGEKYIFIFKIYKTSLSLSKIKRTELDGKLDDFLKVLSSRSAQESNRETYYQSAYKLYQQILEPSIVSLDKKVNKLIIVPDGPLSSVPFEALLNKKYNGSFTGAPYLLHQFEFQYAYSPSLILQEPFEQGKRSGVLAVAPVFKDQQRGLATLNQSEAEINSIETPALKILKGNQATLAAFQAALKNKQILHLSTHAQANSGELPPRIEFADTSLFLPRLYSMHIPADLVVLSTCESNLGVYATGEGVMSLSRGFAYAGAESMIASLWAVNESSTAQLFRNYYQQLKRYSKAKALHHAKLSYLQNSELRDRYKAPYYWAGFVFTGKDGSIEMKTPFWGKPMMALFATLGLGLLFFLRKKMSE